MKLNPFNSDLLTRALEDSGGREICAVVLEDRQGGQEVIRVRNWSRDVDGFFIATSELRRIERYAERQGCKVLAFIHSHSSSLELSDRDRRSLEHSKYPWMVVCLGAFGLQTTFYENPAQLNIRSSEEVRVDEGDSS